MKSLNLTNLVLVGALSLILLVITLAPVEAFCPCSGSISAHRSSTNTNRDTNTDRVIENFTDTMSASTGQITGYIDKLLAGIEKLTDGQSMNDAMRSRQQIRASAESSRYDPAITSCQGMRTAFLISDPDRPGEGETSGETTTRRSYEYENCGAGNETVCAGYQQIARGALDDQQSLRGMGGWPDPTTDIRLLLGDATVGMRSTTSEDVLAQSLWRLRQNIVNPFPERPPTGDQRFQIGGDIALADHLSRQARRSVASLVFEYIENESVPSIDLEQAHIQTLVGDSSSLPLGTTKISERHLYDLFVAGGYRNPEWHVRLAAASPEALTREMVLQQALANDLAWQTLELNRHRALVEATELAIRLEEAKEAGGDG